MSDTARKRSRWLLVAMLLGIACFVAGPALGGSYLDSAHGDASNGVNRSAIDSRLSPFATGNCAHCHETHASIGGTALANGPAAHLLFAAPFDTSVTVSPYQMANDFCFYCHSNDAAAAKVTNRDYSATFGGEVTLNGPQTIMEAFNQASYHNLNDIATFLLDKTQTPDLSTWYGNLGNPCSACHNSHLAKRNWDSNQTNFPLRSTIILPGDSSSLWGETQLMSSYPGYESPYADNTIFTFEPAGVGAEDGSKTSDYASFCISCHRSTSTIASTTLGRDLIKISWAASETLKDKHGAMARDNSASYLREPYATAAATKTNFYLSCMDCHEAHGSPNIMLIRRRINGEDLEGSVSSLDTMSYICKRCHKDDYAANGGTADHWEYAHHLGPSPPYAEGGTCTSCHGATDSSPIACGNCHKHGDDDSWLLGMGQTPTYLKTF